MNPYAPLPATRQRKRSGPGFRWPSSPVRMRATKLLCPSEARPVDDYVVPTLDSKRLPMALLFPEIFSARDDDFVRMVEISQRPGGSYFGRVDVEFV